jgi:hypothetical protein
MRAGQRRREGRTEQEEVDELRDLDFDLFADGADSLNDIIVFDVETTFHTPIRDLQSDHLLDTSCQSLEPLAKKDGVGALKQGTEYVLLLVAAMGQS